MNTATTASVAVRVIGLLALVLALLTLGHVFLCAAVMVAEPLSEYGWELAFLVMLTGLFVMAAICIWRKAGWIVTHTITKAGPDGLPVDSDAMVMDFRALALCIVGFFVLGAARDPLAHVVQGAVNWIRCDGGLLKSRIAPSCIADLVRVTLELAAGLVLIIGARPLARKMSWLDAPPVPRR